MNFKILKDQQLIGQIYGVEYGRMNFSFVEGVNQSIKDSIMEVLGSCEGIEQLKSNLVAQGYIINEMTFETNIQRDLNLEEKRNISFVYQSNLIENIVEISEDELSRQFIRNFYGGHIGAWKYLRDLALAKKPISLSVLSSLHENISIEQKVLGHQIKNEHMGVIRDKDTVVMVGGRVCFPPSEDQLNSMFVKLNKSLEKLISDSFTVDQVLNLASDFHYDYEIIHPYADGNGRTGRLMINYIIEL